MQYGYYITMKYSVIMVTVAPSALLKWWSTHHFFCQVAATIDEMFGYINVMEYVEWQGFCKKQLPTHCFVFQKKLYIYYLCNKS